MAALFQRMLNLLAIASGSETYFVEEPRELMLRLPEIRPTDVDVGPAVLREGSRRYSGAAGGSVRHSKARDRSRPGSGEALVAIGPKRGAPGWALRVRHAILDRLVLRRISRRDGRRNQVDDQRLGCRPIWLLEFFHSIGFLMLEAYGITENPVPIAANRPYAYRFGSVGRPFAVNEVRLADDGEVLVKGSALFKGYRRRGAAARPVYPRGCYRTGDYGQLRCRRFPLPHRPWRRHDQDVCRTPHFTRGDRGDLQPEPIRRSDRDSRQRSAVSGGARRS